MWNPLYAAMNGAFDHGGRKWRGQWSAAGYGCNVAEEWKEEGSRLGKDEDCGLGWWKENNIKFNILSKMAADILAIPVTTVASESAFSAGGRVIDPHRSSLGTKMVDMLVCGADWYRQYYGLEKNKNKQNKDIIHVEIP
ncbi:hypothetical protein F3Y22_tig00111053pilonHSYRG00069 [Hibiscus syriacus]|uniref:HAT C-terminal dimerisation domain-containing protein n=1 Tax=Hibiscus syriacus TaxID=106335 RepID=A0A6A2Z4Y6_HIBSY|nr:hypothetical protein F3Y22_tig00111053pilonHSYRG00069 [Hibiscus syriacus]